MRQLSAAIFDWDGTLVDSMEGIRQATNHALSAMKDKGFEVDIGRGENGYAQWTPEETQLRFASTAAAFFDEAFGAFGSAVSALALKTFHRKLEEVHLANITALDGAMETGVTHDGGRQPPLISDAASPPMKRGTWIPRAPGSAAP